MILLILIAILLALELALLIGLHRFQRELRGTIAELEQVESDLKTFLKKPPPD